jgi:hypothetical protein
VSARAYRLVGCATSLLFVAAVAGLAAEDALPEPMTPYGCTG